MCCPVPESILCRAAAMPHIMLFLARNPTDFDSHCASRSLSLSAPSAEEMVEAVLQARFRIVFLSAPYVKSYNCNSEFNALRGQPGRSARPCSCICDGRGVACVLNGTK